jgi:glycerol-3-phosphate cytidylyltransferase
VFLPVHAGRVVLTYGTFDGFHQGHVRLLHKLSMLGSGLVVGCATDEYAAQLGRAPATPYAQRRLMLEKCRFVSHVIAEQDFERKYTDIINYNGGIFAMGAEWTGRFDHLEEVSQVLYVPRAQAAGCDDAMPAGIQLRTRFAAGH